MIIMENVLYRHCIVIGMEMDIDMVFVIQKLLFSY